MKQPVERKLAAILAADVAGYSRLMGEDEEGTHERLKAHLRELVDPRIKEHRGRTVKNTGDGMLVEFLSVVDAVRCAVEIQREMAERNAAVPAPQRIEFRIGINLGDVLVEEHDIFGDGVNVAARLEALAEPGGICVSRVVRDQVRDKLDFAFEDMGEQQVKNIARPVRVYRVGSAATPEQPAVPATALPLPDKPSIAVMPFANMSGDPEQEYFADGMVEEIITALSRIRSLFVIARNSTFTYKGQAVDVKQVGRELGVHYALEGSVRKAGNRVRITAQLIDASSGAHLWADRFDGSLDDVFDLQDQVTASVVGAIAPKLEQAEIERAKHKPTHSLGAYDYYLRGIASLHRRTREGNDEALQLFNRAVELDPGFPSAYGMAAYCYVWRKTNGWMTDPVQETSEASRLALRAVELGSDDAIALFRAGYALGYVVGDLDRGAALIDRALALNPNLAAGWYASGRIRGYLGEPDLAIEHLERAMRLSPLDMQTARLQSATAFAHFLAGRYDDASSWAQRALQVRPSYPSAIRLAAASSALAGRPEEARQAVERLRQVDPALRVSNLKNRLPLRRPDDLTRYQEGLRMAGLPEQ
jgi:TolB-like protein/tetratricopeptide (TPR) repeat protein